MKIHTVDYIEEQKIKVAAQITSHMFADAFRSSHKKSEIQKVKPMLRFARQSH